MGHSQEGDEAELSEKNHGYELRRSETMDVYRDEDRMNKQAQRDEGR